MSRMECRHQFTNSIGQKVACLKCGCPNPELEAPPERPWCCLEPRCEPLHQLANHDNLSEPRPGESFICFGIMPEGVKFSYDGVDHDNDLRTCMHTALKGLVAFQENEGDWRMTAQAYKSALAKLQMTRPAQSPTEHRKEEGTDEAETDAKPEG